ncbi:hypothetical protein BAUCODRAFT_551842 [Baudoinia panamericana UAMH 10762]|uniref:Uncharacterized protein n=1 Tax=Baudoinia panamericana (strain UAMH 10762) TaxID=717646 RepID=M2N697_BAUPA|nr:uncharacterized protein BAUCODRAFT_551842 [Baudoinia panamericana UAMH 10762]EMC94554.1 hypothetical protein BAUCODRAFT_551842 [Baudoinia panamericana UAMH 10762]
MASPSSSKVRTYILTGCVAAITATGAWYGAGLKTRQEHGQKIVTASTAERIEQMELAKARLLRHRAELRTKIDKLTMTATEGGSTVTGSLGKV